jgi:hypothetical protein
MSTKTTNLGLDKPSMTDTPNITIPQLANNFDVIDSSFADLAKYPYSASKNGIVGDGLTDISTPLQNLVNTIQTAIINNEFGVQNVIEIPGGKYKMTQTVIIPPYVKLKSRGQVIIEWYGTGSCFWITPDANDPTSIYTDELPYNEWLSGDLINGDDGGFIIRNKTTLNPSNPSIGIELGARVNQPAGRWKNYFCLYRITNVAITGFDIAMFFNTYNHFINSFHHLNIQTNTIGVQIGSLDGGNINSGENCTFYNCTFNGNTETVFKITSQFDLNFHGCSMDYNGACFECSYYCVIKYIGGHIEGNTNYLINNTYTQPAFIAFDYPKLYHSKAKLIKGNVTVSGGIVFNNWDETTNTDFNNWFLCDSTVTGYLDLKNRMNAVCMFQQYNHNRVDYMGTALYTITTTNGATVTDDSTETLNGLNTMSLTLPANSSITLQYKYDMNISKYFAKYAYAMKNLTGLSSLVCQMTFQRKRVGSQVDSNTITWDFSKPNGTWTIPPYGGYQELFKYNTVSFAIIITNNTASSITAKMGSIYVEC